MGPVELPRSSLNLTTFPRRLRLQSDMKTLPLRLALLFVVAFLAFSAVMPAGALELPRDPASVVPVLSPAESAGTDVMPMVVWSTVTILGAGVVFGTLYLLKRRVGGFPANPAWVAPITIMPSKDFADEGSFGESPDTGAHH